jgi:8-oxo-dGTP pyrophosphatase MutT (NUDIX family)
MMIEALIMRILVDVTSSDASTKNTSDDKSALRPAATVMLIRDIENEAFEVFMLQRTLNAAFAGGMYVFPGGRVDELDGIEELEQLCDGLDDKHASGLLQIPSGGLAYWVAAIRECFEEAGVLLARNSQTKQLVAFDEPTIIKRFDEARLKIHDSSLSMINLCRSENLSLVTDSIHYVSHWITPVGEARRFDTRFFVARAPESQEPLHDSQETIASLWVQPQDALDKLARGELAMFPPTSENLKFLANFKTTDEVLAAAKKVLNPTAILPRLRTNSDGKVIGVLMPGDPGY